MTPDRYGALAVANILFCVLPGLLAFVAAAFGGFNVFAVAWYFALLASIPASFYLLANRHDLPASALRRAAMVVLATLLIVIAPLLIGLGYALRG
jgi:hypothetical protein